MRPIRRKQMLLPDMWVTHDVKSRSSGRTVKTYYLNLRTRRTFYSKKALYRHFRSMEVQPPDCQCKARDGSKRERAEEEEKDSVCSLCKETGHSCNIVRTLSSIRGTLWPERRFVGAVDVTG